MGGTYTGRTLGLTASGHLNQAPSPPIDTFTQYIVVTKGNRANRYCPAQPMDTRRVYRRRTCTTALCRMDLFGKASFMSSPSSTHQKSKHSAFFAGVLDCLVFGGQHPDYPVGVVTRSSVATVPVTPEQPARPRLHLPLLFGNCGEPTPIQYAKHECVLSVYPLEGRRWLREPGLCGTPCTGERPSPAVVETVRVKSFLQITLRTCI